MLLDTSETGKSTLVKQMKILHQNGYTNKECLEYRPIIIRNTIESLICILNAMIQLNIKFENSECMLDSELFFSSAFYKTGQIREKLDYHFGEFMTRLWLDRGTQACFQRSREYHLNDSAP